MKAEKQAVDLRNYYLTVYFSRVYKWNWLQITKLHSNFNEIRLESGEKTIWS